jgi:hypothetical protein
MERHHAGARGGKSPGQIRAELDAEQLHAQAYGMTPQTVRPDWGGLLICTCMNIYFLTVPESTTATCTRCNSSLSKV